MGFENINLWFAKDSDNETILAKEITEEMRHNEYRCPICKSLVIPKLGQIMTSHFAHRDASKCSSETVIHFWVKNELIKIGDKFKVDIEGKITEYECKELKIEDEYKTSKGTYKPDLTVLTSTDEVIYIEIANTNKKKIKDYIDIWKELNNTVVEVEVKDISEGNKIDCMKAIYYDGKEYHEQLRELNEIVDKEKNKYKFTKEQLDKIDWLINDICKYNNGIIKIDELSDEIKATEDRDLRELVVNIVKNKKCGNILDDYIKYNINTTVNEIKNIVGDIKISTNKSRLIFDRVFYGFKITLVYDSVSILENYDIKYNNIDDINILLCEILKYKEIKKYIEEKCDYQPLLAKNFYNHLYFNIEDSDRFFVNDIDENFNFEIIDKKIKKLKDNEIKKNIFINNIHNIINSIYNNFTVITNIRLLNDNSILNFEYTCFDYKIEYSIETQYEGDYEYFEEEIIKKIKSDFLKNISNAFQRKTGVYCTYLISKNCIYTHYNNCSIPITIEFDKNTVIDCEFIDNIKKIHHERIQNIDKYNDLFKDYYIKCKNTKNNYYITLLDHSLDIYYKDKNIYSLDYFEIEDIDLILSNEFLKKSIIEDIEDYNNYFLIDTVIEDINERYANCVTSGKWRIYKDFNNSNCIKLFDGKRLECNIDIKDIDINNLESELIRILSDYIRKSLVKGDK